MPDGCAAEMQPCHDRKRLGCILAGWRSVMEGVAGVQVKTAVDEALEWLDDNQDAEEDEYKEKLKEVEDVCNPVVSSAYGKGGAGEEDDEDLGDHDEL